MLQKHLFLLHFISSTVDSKKALSFKSFGLKLNRYF